MCEDIRHIGREMTEKEVSVMAGLFVQFAFLDNSVKPTRL